jgi:hypothetical protein
MVRRCAGEESGSDGRIFLAERQLDEIVPVVELHEDILAARIRAPCWKEQRACLARPWVDRLPAQELQTILQPIAVRVSRVEHVGVAGVAGVVARTNGPFELGAETVAITVVDVDHRVSCSRWIPSADDKLIDICHLGDPRGRARAAVVERNDCARSVEREEECVASSAGGCVKRPFAPSNRPVPG